MRLTKSIYKIASGFAVKTRLRCPTIIGKNAITQFYEKDQLGTPRKANESFHMIQSRFFIKLTLYIGEEDSNVECRTKGGVRILFFCTVSLAVRFFRENQLNLTVFPYLLGPGNKHFSPFLPITLFMCTPGFLTFN